MDKWVSEWVSDWMMIHHSERSTRHLGQPPTSLFTTFNFLMVAMVIMIMVIMVVMLVVLVVVVVAVMVVVVDRTEPFGVPPGLFCIWKGTLSWLSELRMGRTGQNLHLNLTFLSINLWLAAFAILVCFSPELLHPEKAKEEVVICSTVLNVRLKQNRCPIWICSLSIPVIEANPSIQSEQNLSAVEKVKIQVFVYVKQLLTSLVSPSSSRATWSSREDVSSSPSTLCSSPPAIACCGSS